MLTICPNCQEEVEVRHEFCPECGETIYKSKKRKESLWDEDEWTESDWGEDLDIAKGGDDDGLPET